MIALARFVALFAWMSVAIATVASAAPPTTWQATVDKAIQPLVDTKKIMGAVVGVLPRDGQREYFFYGQTKADGPTPTSETLFEIGSVSKTFTALLLALAVERGEVKLDDPVRALLPADWPVPRRGEREITLLELATHTSGLPNNPPNLTLRVDPEPQSSTRSVFEVRSRSLPNVWPRSSSRMCPSRRLRTATWEWGCSAKRWRTRRARATTNWFERTSLHRSRWTIHL